MTAGGPDPRQPVPTSATGRELHIEEWSEWPEELRLDIEARIALVQLSGMGPSRTRWLLAAHAAVDVVERLRRGEMPIPAGEAPPGLQQRHLDEWSKQLASLDSEALFRLQVEKGWTILHPTDPRWPFLDEPEPPLLLFCEGDLGLLQHRFSVAIVGTRRCTSVGRSVAHQIGLDLANAGVAVVSGLALGVDAAAHRGALDGGGAVIGVVGSGLDVVYPRTNRSLWNEVGDMGLLLSEYPAGMSPERWRFPARNRIIAALSDGVVIVESHARGGSLLTADEAVDRGLPVMAVPGSVVNPAADGTNELIVEGAFPARNSADVMAVLGIGPGPSDAAKQANPIGQPDLVQIELDIGDGNAEADEHIGGDGADRELIELIRREAATGSVTIDRLIVLSGRAPLEVIRAVERLGRAGEVNVDGSTVVPAPG